MKFGKKLPFYSLVLSRSIGNLKHRTIPQKRRAKDRKKLMFWYNLNKQSPYKGTSLINFRSLGACRQWNWCTALDACCRIRWFWWMPWGKSSWPHQAPSTPGMRQCIRTWEVSTWSSSAHHSTQVSWGSHGTRIRAIHGKNKRTEFISTNCTREV